MDGADQISLVYEHRCNGRKLVPNCLSLLDEMELVTVLSGNPDICLYRKTIKPDQTSIDIYKSDLMEEGDKMVAAAKSKKKGGEAEEVPWKVFLGHEFIGHAYTELVILTPEAKKVEEIKKVEGAGKGKGKK